MALSESKAFTRLIGSVLPMCGSRSQLILNAVKRTARGATVPIGMARDAQIAPQPRVLTRLRTRFRSGELDQALAGGARPESTARLALRARQLIALSRRQSIADGLRRVTRDSCQGVPPSLARISPSVTQVIDAGDDLDRLANTLAAPGPVAAQGVAQAWILLTDGTGPLYNVDSTANLRTRVTSAANNLRLEH